MDAEALRRAVRSRQPAGEHWVQLRAAASVVHREQVAARVDDLLEPLVADGHSHRDLALMDDEFAGHRLARVSH
jgi:hypothetical protein